jgi:membrane-associated phospholipid phosphatase
MCNFKLNFIPLLIVVVHFQLINVAGQGHESPGMGQRFVSDVKDAFNGSVHVFSQPNSWQGDNWLNLGYVVAGAALLSFVDKEIRNVFQRNQSKTADSFARIGEFYGEPLTIVLITGGIYLFGNIMDDKWARETAIIMTAALLPGGIYQTTAKISAGRARPYLELGPHYFDPFRMQEDYYSFVSGHTLAAMGASMVIARQFNSTIAKGLIYSLGILTGLSRVYSDDHWSSDVFLGAALAVATSHSAASWIDNDRNVAQGKLKWLVSPAPNGIRLVLMW